MRKERLARHQREGIPQSKKEELATEIGPPSESLGAKRSLE